MSFGSWSLTVVVALLETSLVTPMLACEEDRYGN